MRLPIPNWKRSYFSVPASVQVLIPLMVIRVAIIVAFRMVKNVLTKLGSSSPFRGHSYSVGAGSYQN
ncbi:hypothetical protein M080_5119, partial [Bacteroides fragilis str. 3397 T10]